MPLVQSWATSLRLGLRRVGRGVPLGYTLRVGCSGAGLFLGEVEVGLWRGLCEDEVEGRAMASWTDRRRSPAWELGLVFGAGSAGAVACAQILHFLFLDEPAFP